MKIFRSTLKLNMILPSTICSCVNKEINFMMMNKISKISLHTYHLYRIIESTYVS